MAILVALESTKPDPVPFLTELMLQQPRLSAARALPRL